MNSKMCRYYDLKAFNRIVCHAGTQRLPSDELCLRLDINMFWTMCALELRYHHHHHHHDHHHHHHHHVMGIPFHLF